MKAKKEVRITLRLTQEQYDAISRKAETAQMPVGTYVRAAALKHKVTVVDGVKGITRELKGIGNNINRLTVLANMGKVNIADLSATTEVLYEIYGQIGALMRKEER